MFMIFNTFIITVDPNPFNYAFLIHLMILYHTFVIWNPHIHSYIEIFYQADWVYILQQLTYQFSCHDQPSTCPWKKIRASFVYISYGGQYLFGCQVFFRIWWTLKLPTLFSPEIFDRDPGVELLNTWSTLMRKFIKAVFGGLNTWKNIR